MGLCERLGARLILRTIRQSTRVVAGTRGSREAKSADCERGGCSCRLLRQLPGGTLTLVLRSLPGSAVVPSGESIQHACETETEA
jgi:hypothetical protein